MQKVDRPEINSMEELIALVEFDGFLARDCDPTNENSLRVAEENKESILQRVFNSTQGWEQVLDQYRQGSESYWHPRDLILPNLELYLSVDVHIWKGRIFILIAPVNANWFLRRYQELAPIYYKEIVFEQYLASDITTLNPRRTTQFTRAAFSQEVFYSTPEQGILEAVTILNELGITTVESCEGHPETGKMPFIFFKPQQIENVLSLLEIWQQQGGGEWIIIPGYRPQMESVRVQPFAASVTEAQQEIKRFIEFLRSM